jgi:hypothetical protein
MAAQRPFVDRPVTDPTGAAAAASRASAAWSLATPRLLRTGMNALYECDDVVLRVGSTTAPPDLAHALADVLLDHGVPTAVPVDGLAGTFGGWSVTGWRRVAAVDGPIDWLVVGRAVRHVHDLPVELVPAGYPLPSPTSFPWWDFDGMLADVAADLDDAALAGLRSAIERRRWWRDAVGEGAVVCHGDVHPGNVLVTTDGPLLLDWDLLCRAAPAWDHAMLTTVADRWGGEAGTYEAFAVGYGRSLAADPLTQALATLRNVAATLMRVRAGRVDPGAAAEAERRLRYWRGDPAAPAWRAQ